MLKDVLRWVGSPAQLYGIEDYRLAEGKAQGTRCMRMYNATGLSLTVLPDRGMDIANLSIKGENLSFLSCTGVVNSSYFTEDGARGFFRNFFAGFLTTGGLTYMGAACEEQGEVLGLHGVVSNIPAQQVASCACEQNLQVSGLVRQARVFGENLVLRRCVNMRPNGNEFSISDEIENQGFRATPFMLLYHMNFGYPLVCPDTILHLPTHKIQPRDVQAQNGLEHYLAIEPPKDNRPEQVFFHTMKPDEDDQVHFAVENPARKIAVVVSYPYAQLPYFTQWKSMASGEYALGLEPGNCHVMGRVKAREEKCLQMLAPGETVRLKLRIRVLYGQESEDLKEQGLLSKG